jgi:hypothetical protein
MSQEFNEYAQSDTEEYQKYARSDTEENQSEHDKKHQNEHNGGDNGNSTLTPGMCFYTMIVFNQVSFILKY